MLHQSCFILEDKVLKSKIQKTSNFQIVIPIYKNTQLYISLLMFVTLGQNFSFFK